MKKIKKLIIGLILGLFLGFSTFICEIKTGAVSVVINPITSVEDIPVGATISFNQTLDFSMITTTKTYNLNCGSSRTDYSVHSFDYQSSQIGRIYFYLTPNGTGSTITRYSTNGTGVTMFSQGSWSSSTREFLVVREPLKLWLGSSGAVQDASDEQFIDFINTNAVITIEQTLPQSSITFYSYTGAIFSTYSADQNEPLLMDFAHSEREGYTFRGWSFTSGALIPDIVYGTEWTPTASSYDLYEVWQDNGQVIITFDANGGTGTPPQAVSVQKNSNYTLPSNPGLTRTNYEFDGWSKNPSATSGSAPGSQIEVLDTGFTLYAIWVLEKKTLTLNLQGGNIPGGITTYNINYGTTYNLDTLNTPVKTGYIFLGWGLTSDATEYISQITMTSNKTIYAIWGTATQDLATITFNSNDATGGAVPGSIQVIKGQQYTLPSNPGELVRIGYTFIGWGLTSDATTPVYTITPSSNMTLYAIWNELNYAKVYLQVNGQPVATTRIYNGLDPTFYVRFNEFNNDYFYIQITAHDGVNYSNVDYNYIWNIIYNSTDKYGRALYTFNGSNIEKIIITTPSGTTEYDQASIDLAHYVILYYYNNNDVYTINIITEPNTDINNFNNIVSSIFNGAQTLLNIKVGWFSIGSLVAVVLAIGVLFFVIRIGKGGSSD